MWVFPGWGNSRRSMNCSQVSVWAEWYVVALQLTWPLCFANADHTYQYGCPLWPNAIQTLLSREYSSLIFDSTCGRRGCFSYGNLSWFGKGHFCIPSLGLMHRLLKEGWTLCLRRVINTEEIKLPPPSTHRIFGLNGPLLNSRCKPFEIQMVLSGTTVD